MSTTFLAVLVVAPTAAVVAALTLVMWIERTSPREARVAAVAGTALAAWFIGATMLAARGLVGASAPWVASQLDAPTGRRRAIVFNLLGLADLVVAVFLGMATSPGPARLFHTTPTSAVATRFPLALVPTFLVPLAIMLHVVSLWQLVAGTWARSVLDVRARRLEA